MNFDNTKSLQNNEKISVDQMWSLIKDVLTPWDIVPDKTKMSDEQILKLYHIINEANEMFKMLAQIAELKKTINELTKK